MKALSLTQPWATLIAIGAKKIETRSWRTPYRGQIAIHASKGFPAWAKDDCMSLVFARALWPDLQHDSVHLLTAAEYFTHVRKMRARANELPLGSIIAVANLRDCIATRNGGAFFPPEMPHHSSPEYAFGDYSPNRYMWLLENVTALAVPIPCRGALSLWEVPENVERQIREQVDA